MLNVIYKTSVDDPSISINGSIKYEDYNIFHKHNYYEIFLVIDGEYIHELNGEIKHMKQGDGFIVRPNDVHRIEAVTDKNKHLYVAFEKSFFEDACESMTEGVLDTIKHVDKVAINFNETNIYKIIDLINTNYIQNNKFKKAVVGKIIVNKFLENAIQEMNMFEDKRPEWLNDLLFKIKNENNIRLRIVDFVEMTPYSQTQLERKFKEYMGVTLAKYLQTVRLGYAMKYLLYSELSIAEICNIIGYYDVSHFIHIFKERYNMSPLKYRATFKKK
ncbi:MAG: AraC family transcriptional regulator [Bacilli bacterium]|nr:AraC family transcriptional regulator [Bacilli bacterium]